MRLIFGPLALLLTLSVPGVALAQVPPPPSGSATQPQPQPQPSGELTEEQKQATALEKYKQAEALSEQKRWAEAIPLYEAASASAGKLRDLSTNQTASGFPIGDYACRDVATNACPYKLENRLGAGNVLAYVGLPLGGAALVGGVAMLAIYVVHKNKTGGEMATVARGRKVELSSLGPVLLPAGGAGAAAELHF